MTARGKARYLNRVFFQFNDVPVVYVRNSSAGEVKVVGAERAVPVRKIVADA